MQCSMQWNLDGTEMPESTFIVDVCWYSNSIFFQIDLFLFLFWNKQSIDNFLLGGLFVSN